LKPCGNQIFFDKFFQNTVCYGLLNEIWTDLITDYFSLLRQLILLMFIARIYQFLEKYRLTDAVLITLIVILKVLYKIYKV